MLKRFLRGSSSQGSQEKQAKEKEKAKYNLPRIAEVRPCEWPCDNFLKEAGIHEDIYSLIENAGLTDFLHGQIDQYLLLTNTFVQHFYYYPKKSPPSVSFHLYDEFREMSLRNFCTVCRIPYEGELEEPHREDVDGFVKTIAVEEPKKGSEAKVSSIHFPVLRYFAIFASRCLIGRGNSGNFNVPNIIILHHALFGDNSFSMGDVIAKRLSLNRTKGPIFGGIYAARLAKHFEIPIRHHEEDEIKLHPHILDYKSMVAHKFIVDNKEKMLLYKLRFNKKHFEIIILPAPLLFDLLAENFLSHRKQ